jgi:hypothetical protein
LNDNDECYDDSPLDQSGAFLGQSYCGQINFCLCKSITSVE